MTSFVNIALRSEFSFKKTFGRIDSLADYANGALGIADLGNTFSHVYLDKLSKKHGFKPLYGVRLEVVEDSGIRTRGISGPIYIFIARTQEGVCEINKLVKISSEKFYFKSHITISDMISVSENVIVIAESVETFDRCDFVALTPSTSPLICAAAIDNGTPIVYVNNNYYNTPEDKKVYQLIAGSHKRGDDYYYNFDDKSVKQHIQNEFEFFRVWKSHEAILNTQKIADMVESFELKRAPMVSYSGYRNIDVWCEKGAKKLGVDLNDPIYKARYEREMNLIIEKKYVDYFMIVHEMIEKAKAKMFVGPARGSSCGSLVCYLLGITTIDPLKFDLLFERFIDVNRFDLPDIDIDFNDVKRPTVIKDLIKKYGENNVCSISNINRLKAKSAIGEFATALRVPKYESDEVSSSITSRSGGDARASMSIIDTFESTDAGKLFIKKYPAMLLCAKAEGHAAAVGKHAAGIIVCNDDVTQYGGVDVRTGSIMLDKKTAEYLNLLKIDILGLRTLTILEECAGLIGMDYNDYYNLPLDDEKTYQVFLEMRLQGIFQFEGSAMQQMCKQMGVEHFGDIVAITAIARPGPLHSGGAGRFISRRTGQSEVEYITEHESYVNATKETYGEFIYQEQLMNVCRNLGQMDWADVSAIRNAMSKSLGEEFFNKYKVAFVDGAMKNGVSEIIAEKIWGTMITFGSWGMNKSHTVAYGHISYWCAYMKAHHPLEFTAANLKHAKDKNSAIRILRDAVENEGIEYVAIDPDESEVDWCAKNGRLIGGLVNIKGIAESKAKEIIRMRNGERKYTPAMTRILMNPVTDFDTIYPCRDKFGKFYTSPKLAGLSSPVSYVKEISENADCEYIVLGKVTKKDLRDLNEYNEVQKRNGVVYSKNSKFLKIVIEDDTGEIQCRINRFKFDDMDGQKWSDALIEDETYVLLKGTIREGIRILHINGIFDITNFEFDEDEEDE
jgi:DNA polymerase III alpha subunit